MGSTWTLDLLHYAWVGVFGVIFVLLIAYHVMESIEKRKKDKK
ncbi:hypothetical protein [Alkaliphilus pronyensis]|nr:hypothetical protein [Alkaliphilus pronyensis]